MTREQWEKIQEAAGLFDLGEKASLAEIKRAFRRLSKECHPDLQDDSKEKVVKVEMQKLIEAYQVLLHYCTEYRFPLVSGDDEQLEAEDWWFERFGNDDHHWGKGVPQRKGGKK